MHVEMWRTDIIDSRGEGDRVDIALIRSSDFINLSSFLVLRASGGEGVQRRNADFLLCFLFISLTSLIDSLGICQTLGP
jgi:hypothetical protein